MKTWTLILLLIPTLGACSQTKNNPEAADLQSKAVVADTGKVVLSESEWRKKLTPMQYQVIREKGTEKPYSGEYLHTKDTGVYCCAACKVPLFASDTKFDVCGWPSFFKPITEGAIGYHQDRSHGMVRTEVVCNRCGGHLGHVFDDGPPPSGQRYCINSVSLIFEPLKK